MKTAIREFVQDQNIEKRNPSFFIYRSDFVYTIFFSGHINCTKIKSYNDINTAVKNILDKFGLNYNNILKLQIDNILAVGRISYFICLQSFGHFLQSKGIQVQYNPQRFPGLCIKKSPSSSLTFLSGKVILTGIKSETELKHSWNFFKQLYYEYCRMPSFSKMANMGL